MSGASPGPDRPWAQLVTAALLGTTRRPFGSSEISALPAAVADPAQTCGGDPAEQLLTSAALMTAYRLGGLTTRTAEIGPPGPATSGRPVGVAATDRIESLIASQQWPLVAQWLDLVHERGLTLPPEVLPQLLDLASGQRTAVQTEGIRHRVASLLDERGVWLARQHPRWRTLLEAPEGPGHAGSETRAVWTHGSLAERRDWLVQLRATNPDEARTLLASGWSTEDGPAREALLPVLASSSSPADKEFLESALRDRRQAVRDTAVRLLRTLPDPARDRRLALLLNEHVTVSKGLLGRKITLHMDKTIDDAGQQDIDRAAATWLGHPAQTSDSQQHLKALLRLVATAPRSTWTTLGLTSFAARLSVVDDGPDQALRAALNHGWANAAAAHRDEAWAYELLEAVISSGNGWSTAATLLLVVQPSARPSLVQRLLEKADDVPETESFENLPQVLATLAGPWSAGLTRAVISWPGLVDRPGTKRGPSWSRAQVLDKIGLLACPEETPTMEARVPTIAPTAQEHAESALTMLRLRRSILEELS